MEKWVALVKRLKVDWNEGTLPIMAMDDIGLERENLDGFQCGSVEKGEPFGIVRIVPMGRAIKFQTVKINRGV